MLRLIGEISRVASAINLEGKHHVFVDNSGHVCILRVRVYVDGWGPGKAYTAQHEMYYKTSKHRTATDCKQDLGRILAMLRKLHKTGALERDLLMLFTEAATTRHYG